jgi:hypothetical protein
MKRELEINTLDLAMRLHDRGFHPLTVTFSAAAERLASAATTGGGLDSPTRQWDIYSLNIHLVTGRPM